MRTPDSGTRDLRGQRSVQLKVTIGATLYSPGTDLTAYEGRDWVVGAEWGANVDQGVGVASVQLWREEHWLSLAPLNAGSKCNVSGGAYDPLLALGALVIISTSEAVSRAAADAPGSAQPWHEVFRGRLIEIDWAGNPMTLRVGDMASEVADAWLQRQRWYGRGHQHRGTLVWQPELPVALDELCMASDARAVSDVWQCYQAGTTGTTEPNWRSVVWAAGKRVESGDRVKLTTSEFWIVTSVGGNTGSTVPAWTTASSPINDGDVTWTKVTGASTPRDDGSVKWSYYAIGSGLWTPKTKYELGDYVASRRLGSRVWTPSTVFGVGECCLQDPATVARYVCTNSTSLVSLSAVAATDYVETPPYGWNPLFPEAARNVLAFDGVAAGLYEGVPVCDFIGYAGFLRYNFTPSETGSHVFKYRVFGCSCLAGSKLRALIGPAADLDTATGDFSSGAESETYLDLGNPSYQPTSGTIEGTATVTFADTAARVLILRFEASQQQPDYYNWVPHVVVDQHPEVTRPAGGSSGVTEPVWGTVAPSPGDSFSDGDLGWTRVNDDRSTTSDEDRFICTVAGFSGATLADEPNWPTTEGASVSETTGARWTRIAITADGLIPIEAVLAGMLEDAAVDNGLTTLPRMSNLVSPGYYLKPFPQEQMGCLDAMRRVAAQIGWDLRLRYVPTAADHETWGRWRLSLFEPDRTTTTSLATFGADDYQLIRRGSQKLAEIRNVVELTYSDWDDMQPDGANPKRKRLVVEDAASIVKYGRRWIGLGAGTSNLVNTLAEANALAAAILSDLAEPTADVEVELPLRWWVELGDLYTLSADGRLWSDDQKLAVVGYKHLIRSGDARTALQMRGKPSAGVRRWHERGVGPGKAAPSVPVGPLAPGEITVADEVKGGVITFEPPPTLDKPGAGGGFAKAELHLSLTNGFTPSAATLKSISTSTRFDVTGLTAGVTYYGRIVSIDVRGNRSPPSPQFTLRPTGVQGAQLSLSGDASVEVDAQVPFDTADVDPQDWRDGANKAIDIGADGYYRVRAEGTVTGLSTGDTAGWVFKANGTAFYTGPQFSVGAAGGVSAECLVWLDDGDELRVYLDAADTATVKAGATFSAMRTILDR